MEKMSARRAAELCGGSLCGENTGFRGAVRDNRGVSGGEMFVAIKGERFDGHDFVRDAEEKGAACALVSHKTDGVSIPQIVTDDTVSAFGKIAKGYIDGLPAKRVCITGSVGKTTTKEMIYAVLSEKFKTYKTQGNYNNNIGLPLTIFGMDKTTEAAVLEIGTNHFGEILPLAEIASPDIAVITTIGNSHLEAFGTREGVLREKLDILKGLKKGGTAVLNGDNELLWNSRADIRNNTVWFGQRNERCDVFGQIISTAAEKTVFSVRDSSEIFEIRCGGAHNVSNALSAIAVGRALGMTDSEIAHGLKKFVNTGMRQDIYEFDGITIIRDCYNANPDSMCAAVSLLGSMKCEGKRICVFGDMLELGNQAELLHEKVGECAAQTADCIFVCGDFADCYKKGAGEKTEIFGNKEELAKRLSLFASKGDIILVKGSWGTKMWQVLEYLQGERK